MALRIPPTARLSFWVYKQPSELQATAEALARVCAAGPQLA